MEFYEGSYPYIATIYLDDTEEDGDSFYNILAYYRMSKGYTEDLAKDNATHVMCEKMFLMLREALR